MPIFTLTDDVRPITPEMITKNVTPPIPEEVKSIPFYMNHTVFLQNELCSHCPHQLHCIQVFPGMTLILVSEVGFLLTSMSCMYVFPGITLILVAKVGAFFTYIHVL